MENKGKRLIVFHEHNAMTDEGEIQILTADREIVLVITHEDLPALEAAGLHPYKYDDIIEYAFHQRKGQLEAWGYSKAIFEVRWSPNNTDELQREWESGIEAYTVNRAKARAIVIGKRIEHLLFLKFSKAGRIETEWGSKTVEGLGRCIERIVDEIREGGHNE